MSPNLIGAYSPNRESHSIIPMPIGTPMTIGSPEAMVPAWVRVLTLPYSVSFGFE